MVRECERKRPSHFERCSSGSKQRPIRSRRDHGERRPPRIRSPDIRTASKEKTWSAANAELERLSNLAKELSALEESKSIIAKLDLIEQTLAATPPLISKNHKSQISITSKIEITSLKFERS